LMPTEPPEPSATTPPQGTLGAVQRSSYNGLVTAVGDSVMLGAVNDLRRAFAHIDIDAVKGRTVSSGITALKAFLKNGTLGDVVVIHLGTNDYFTAKQFDQIMSLVGSTRKAIFLNDKVPRYWENYNNSSIAAGVQRYPNAVLLDWRSESVSTSGLLYSDGIHLRPAGSHFYVNLISSLVGQ